MKTPEEIVEQIVETLPPLKVANAKTKPEKFVNVGIEACIRLFNDNKPQLIVAIKSCHPPVGNSIFAITNLDAEDLGSSIIATYWDGEKAHEELQLIESGNHPELFGGGVLEVFEIKLP